MPRKKVPKPLPSPKTKFQLVLQERNLSQQDIADATKLHKAQISLIANGRKNYTMLTLMKLCMFLNCAPNDILPWELWLEKSKSRKSDKK